MIFRLHDLPYGEFDYDTRRNKNRYYEIPAIKAEEKANQKAKQKTVTNKGTVHNRRVRTLDDLREISALKDKITKKDAQIKRLKKTIQKLKDPNGEIAKKVEKKKEEEFLLENPDFLDL